jgi:hypothetical protein
MYSDYRLNRYTEFKTCLGKTRCRHQCKVQTRDSYKCYGVELPVCRWHRDQNAIYTWSRSRTMERVPENIKNFLLFFLHCKNCGFSPLISVLIAAELFESVAGYPEGHVLLKLFRDSVFTKTSGECGVCYEDGPAVSTRCGHVFCEPCIHEWTNQNITCPMCRKKISGN